MVENVADGTKTGSASGSGVVVVDVELVEGVNEISLMVEAVEKIYFYELIVELDTTPPILEIIT